MNKLRRWDGNANLSSTMTQINIGHFALAKFHPCARMELSATPFLFWHFVFDNMLPGGCL
jgi:hypothetical protein